MSDIEKLDVTLELPASEFMEHEGTLLVRCPLNGVWVPLTDYYSETQGSLLPLVGNANFSEAPEHWVVSDPDKLDSFGNPVMVKVPKESPVEWKETVRILPKVDETPPEGGTLSFHVEEEVGTQDKFGG